MNNDRTRKRNGVHLAAGFALLAFAGACSFEHGTRTEWSQKENALITKPYRGGDYLTAGRRQDFSIEFVGSMEKVYGLLNGTTIQFTPVDMRNITWQASFEVPKYDSLGPDKTMTVFAFDYAGEPVVSSTAPIPVEWMQRGPNGEFPPVPEEYRAIKVPIRK